MIPNLFTSTILAGLIFLGLGALFIVSLPKWEDMVRRFPRSDLFSKISMVIGGGWFLWKITLLTKSDFGDYKQWLFLLFAATILGSILYVKDFLAVRGLAIILLLSANVGLKSAYALYEIPQRLIFVTCMYLIIIAALYYGTIPFKMRDTINWLYANGGRAKAVGGIFALAGAACVVAAFTY